MDKVNDNMGTNELAEGFERIYQAVMALPDIAYEVSGDYRRLTIQATGNVALFPFGNTGTVNIYGRQYHYVTRASWKRIRRLCAGKAILPGVWAYNVPRNGGEV